MYICMYVCKAECNIDITNACLHGMYVCKQHRIGILLSQTNSFQLLIFHKHLHAAVNAAAPLMYQHTHHSRGIHLGTLSLGPSAQFAANLILRRSRCQAQHAQQRRGSHLYRNSRIQPLSPPQHKPHDFSHCK